MISFIWPWVFAVLPLPFVLRWILPRAGGSSEAALKVPDLAPFQLEDGTGISRIPKARWPLLLYTLAWLCLVIAAARPQWTGEAIELPVSGRDLMLAIDISRSMDCRFAMATVRSAALPPPRRWPAPLSKSAWVTVSA